MQKLKYTLTSLIVILLMVVTAYVGFRLAFRGLILPKTQIAGVEVTGMDKDSTIKLLESYFESDPSKIMLEIDGKNIMNLDSIKVSYDVDWAVNQALGVGRNGNILTQISEEAKTLLKGRSIDVPVSYNTDDLIDTVDHVTEIVNQDPIWPEITKEGEVFKLIPGKNGVEVNTDLLSSEIIKEFGLPGLHIIQVPTTRIDTQENEKLVNDAISNLKKWSNNQPRIGYKDFQRTLSNDEFIKLFGLVNEPVNSERFEALVNELKDSVETDPRDAIFVFEENKVNEFMPEVIGTTIDIPKLRAEMADYLAKGEATTLEIPVILTYPKVRTGDINNLGIKELIGTGKSTFSHSIPGRVFNVNLAASRVNGTLVAPGEEFSFVSAVGDISRATGYQSAYIISAGRTILGDGGGVCQVSTTTFRAALDAGLPITERKAHAYRVGYYEQDSPPGIDATIYYPTADLKFLNDTDNYILIQESVDTKNLSMRVDIYGTSDGRKATISKSRISNQVPPPATLYQDDPTLPAGTVKQVDWAAWGARVAFDYKVERNGVNIYEKTFVSNYQPWQAIYLRGTGELAAR